MPGAKIRTLANTMLVNPGSKVRCYANIDRATIAVGHDVDPAALSLTIHGGEGGDKLDPGSSPG